MPRKESDLTIVQRANKLIDELYQENDHLKEDKRFLDDRCAQLEQLVKDYRELMQSYQTYKGPPRETPQTSFGKLLLSAETRYKAVFGEQEGK